MIDMDKLVSIQIAGWLACLAFVVGLVNGLFKLRQNALGNPPQPSNPELGLSQQELRARIQEAQEDVENIRIQHARDREADRVSATARSSGIYKKIDDMSDRMNTKIEDCERRMTEKQERLPERIIAMLDHRSKSRTQ